MTDQLAILEQCRQRYGPGSALQVGQTLAALQRAELDDAASLLRFHDLLLFLRAFPHSANVVRLTEKLLAGIGARVADLRKQGADLALLDEERFSGIANTAIRDSFTYEVALWLLRHYSEQVSADWDLDEQGRQMAISLPSVLPLIADDCLVEADTPYLKWLGSAAGDESRIVPWLMRRLDQWPIDIQRKTAWYDGLRISLSWELGESRASRTHARHNPRRMYYHREPLIRRNQVSLDREMESQALPLRRLSATEGEGLLDLVREALTVRYRELYGTTRGDPGSVVEADVGRGVHIFLWGLPPDRRLPLRAYHGGITFKNGVPINYIEGISLFEWMEVGFNTFYAYREGETAWIYSKVLHLLHQLTGVSCISVYPYQLGHENEEAIQSGAFWFYRKLGFRPGRPELLALAQREEARMTRDPAHRTSAATLRKLASHHVFYEFGDRPRGAWDTFSVRSIGLAVQREMARRFHGDPDKMRQRALASLSKTLQIDARNWGTLERAALQDFALVLSLAPEMNRWKALQKQALVPIIRAKVARDETVYLRRLQQHDPLRQVFLRLGWVAVQPTV